MYDPVRVGHPFVLNWNFGEEGAQSAEWMAGGWEAKM